MMKKNVIYLGTLISESKDVPSIVENTINELTKTDFWYRDQLIIKFKEYLDTIRKEIDDENAFLKRIKEIVKDLRILFKKEGILFYAVVRRKSLFSLLRKMNRVIDELSSIDSIHDINGIEFIIMSQGPVSTEESINKCYRAANIIMEYFSNSNLQSSKAQQPFILCDKSNMKKTVSSNFGDDWEKKYNHLITLNKNIFLPKKSELDLRFRYACKDYIADPKFKTAYQGLQFVVKDPKKNSYFEIQIKDQPIKEFLEDPNSPGNHDIHDMTKEVENPFFILEFEPSKAYHIFGFRENPLLDRSGILAPIKWDLAKYTHF